MGTVSSVPLIRLGLGGRQGASSLIALVLLACSGGGTSDGPGGAGGTGGAAGSGSGGVGGKPPESVVWVGAHPDDELYVAPWLAWLCIEQKASCTFVVMTRGESGNCGLGGGCTPDLATVRDSEMAAAAKLFGAKLVHWDLGDGKAGNPSGVAAHWAEQHGSSDGLVAALAAHLSGADRVITFDPRHGESCHHDHRAAGAYALAAGESIGLPRSRVSLVASKGVLSPAAPADEAVWSFDANQILASSGEPAWSTPSRCVRGPPESIHARGHRERARRPPRAASQLAPRPRRRHPRRSQVRGAMSRVRRGAWVVLTALIACSCGGRSAQTESPDGKSSATHGGPIHDGASQPTVGAPTASARQEASPAGPPGGPGLPPREISEVVMKEFAAMRSCYESSDFGRDLRSGSVTIVWTIGTTGEVTRADASHVGFSDESVSACIRDRFLRLRFKAAGAPTSATWTFAFKPRAQ